MQTFNRDKIALTYGKEAYQSGDFVEQKDATKSTVLEEYVEHP